MQLTFILLALAIGAVWVPNVSLGGRLVVQPWYFLFAAATVSGLASGVLSWHALIPLALLISASRLSQRRGSSAARMTFTLIAALMALALGLHAVPGFNNPIVLDGVRVSQSAVPFTHYANFDKGAAGLILLAFFCQRVSSIDDAHRIAVPTLAAAVLTSGRDRLRIERALRRL